jgi:hypothetical protein
MQFNFDIDKIIDWLLPAVLQKPKHKSWLKTLLNYLNFIHYDFLNTVYYNRLDVQKNGQVIVLEKVIKNHLSGADLQTRGQSFNPRIPNPGLPINLVEVEIIDFPFDYNIIPLKLKREMLTNDDIIIVPLASEGEAIPCGTIDELEPPFDFQVNVTGDYDINEVRSVVDKYKIFGRTYLINIIK